MTQLYNVTLVFVMNKSLRILRFIVFCLKITMPILMTLKKATDPVTEKNIRIK